MKLRELGEMALIKRLAAKTRLDSSVIKGIGDDAAVIKWTRDKYLLLTCDMLVEGVHFKKTAATPYEIGWKALGRNISDMAAMGGFPRYALISIGISPDADVSLADGIYRGVSELAKRFGVNLVGGDTARSDKLVIDVSLIGAVEKRNLTLRSGARKGDVILITGAIGGSSKGRHLRFMPRIEESRAIVKKFRVNSMIDISDGLLLDLWRILDASGAGCRIYKDLIPLSRDADSFEKAVSEGEDFELLFTMNRKEAKRFFRQRPSKMKILVTMIGEIMDAKYGYRLILEGGREKNIKAKGYLHF